MCLGVRGVSPCAKDNERRCVYAVMCAVCVLPGHTELPQADLTETARNTSPPSIQGPYKGECSNRHTLQHTYTAQT